jgi:hypothetical protein
LGDFWTFSFATQSFSRLTINYQCAAASYTRSNHTACYHEKTQAIYLFGGSVGRDKYNDLHVLHVPSLTLRLQDVTCEDLPTRRTYHSGEIINDSMFIIGGEGDHGDLQDLSVLDITAMKWLYPAVSGPLPRRRFLTSTAIGERLYLFGGCVQDYQHFE